jgi:predicted DNA-binding protein
MSDQLLIRIDPALKDKLERMARAEGKTSSGMIRELISDYVKEHDLGVYIDDLWKRIGDKFKSKGLGPADIEKALKAVRGRK